MAESGWQKFKASATGLGSDFFLPETFTLADGPVMGLETSETDPRVIFDKDGIRATRADGSTTFDLKAVDGSAHFEGDITLLEGHVADYNSPVPPESKLEWLDGPGGIPVLDIKGFQSPGGGGEPENWIRINAKATDDDTSQSARSALSVSRANGNELGRLEVLSFPQDGGITNAAARIIFDNTGLVETLLTDSDYSSYSRSNDTKILWDSEGSGFPTAYANHTFSFSNPGTYFFFLSRTGFTSSGGGGLVKDVLKIQQDPGSPFTGDVVLYSSFYHNNASEHHTYPIAVGSVDISSAGTWFWSWGSSGDGVSSDADGNDRFVLWISDGTSFF